MSKAFHVIRIIGRQKNLKKRSSIALTKGVLVEATSFIDESSTVVGDGKHTIFNYRIRITNVEADDHIQVILR